MKPRAEPIQLAATLAVSWVVGVVPDGRLPDSSSRSAGNCPCPHRVVAAFPTPHGPSAGEILQIARWRADRLALREDPDPNGSGRDDTFHYLRLPRPLLVACTLAVAASRFTPGRAPARYRLAPNKGPPSLG